MKLLFKIILDHKRLKGTMKQKDKYLNGVKFVRFIAVLLYGLFVQGCRTIQPAAPPESASYIPPPPQTLSEIEVPVRIDLTQYFKQAETAVPSSYSGKADPCEGLRYSYYFERSPFSFSGKQNTLYLDVAGAYKINLSYCAKCAFGECIVPKINASCGYGEALRKINVGFSTSFSIARDYTIQSLTRLEKLSPVDRCNMTVFNLDATDRLIGFVKPELNKLAAEVDKKIAAYPLKPEIQELWNTLNTEMTIGSFGFMSLNPKTIGVSALQTDGTLLNFSVILTANPILRTQSQKNVPGPLPNLIPYKPGNGFTVNMDLQLGYDTLSRYITQAVKDKVIMIKNKKVILKEITVYGIGQNKIATGIRFEGSRKGMLYLTGTPVYNSSLNMLEFPDLQFDVRTKSVLLKMARWMFSEKITKSMRSEARYNFTTDLDQTKKLLNKELNRVIDANIATEGTVNHLIVNGIYPTSGHLLIRTTGKGDMKINMR